METFQEHKRDIIAIAIIFLLLCISIGYAALSSNLNINGSSQIKNAQWNIYWNNVQITSGSVTPIANPVIDTNKTTVTYEVHFNTPGDFFEFTVDAKNNGSIDAMIDSVISKLNGTEITSLPDYLDYHVTFLDGSSVVSGRGLYAGTKDTYKVRVEYKKDISASELPSTDQNLNFSFTVTYVQADGSEINPNPHYIVHSPQLNLGGVLGSGWERDYIRSTPEEAIADWNTNVMGNRTQDYYYIVNYTNGRGEIVEHGLGFLITNDMVASIENVVAGSYYLKSGADNVDNNINIVKNAFGYATNPSRCSASSSNYNCSIPHMRVTIYNDGRLTISDREGPYYVYDCQIFNLRGMSAICNFHDLS